MSDLYLMGHLLMRLIAGLKAEAVPRHDRSEDTQGTTRG